MQIRILLPFTSILSAITSTDVLFYGNLRRIYNLHIFYDRSINYVEPPFANVSCNSATSDGGEGGGVIPLIILVFCHLFNENVIRPIHKYQYHDK